MHQFLENSLKLAMSLDSYNKKFNVFCFVFEKNRLLSVGRNNMLQMSKKAYDIGKRFNIRHWVEFPFVHSEVDAIGRLWARNELTGKERIVVVRLDKRGNPRIAKPCHNCNKFLSAVGINEIYYTTERGWEHN